MSTAKLCDICGNVAAIGAASKNRVMIFHDSDLGKEVNCGPAVWKREFDATKEVKLDLCENCMRRLIVDVNAMHDEG